MEQTDSEIEIYKYEDDELDFIREEIKNKYEIAKVIPDDEIKDLLKNAQTDIERGCIITGFIMTNVDKTFENNKELCEQYKNGYLERPPFLFYTSKDGLSIRRVIGIGKRDSGEIVAEAVSAMLMFNNKIVGGIEFDELVPIKKWNTQHLDKLNSGMVMRKDAFLEVLGFAAFAE